MKQIIIIGIGNFGYYLATELYQKGHEVMVIEKNSNRVNDSILTTLNVKDRGVKYIIAKALSEPHGRILEKVGASEVIFPEKDLAISLARRLHNPNMIDYLPFIEGYTILELAPPQRYLGKSLEEINLTNTYGVQVIAVKDIINDRLNIIPTGKYILKDSDLLILLGQHENLDKLREKE